jgi:OOP family OmpA-OmpF porin
VTQFSQSDVDRKEPRVIADRMIKALGGFATWFVALFIALSCTLIFAPPSPAADEASDKASESDIDEIYIQYSGGVTYLPNQNLTAADASGTNIVTGNRFSGHAESQVGFNVGGAVGMRFYEYFRAELEYIYRQNETQNLTIQGESPRNASGHIGLMTLMANGYIDYDIGLKVIPYVGVGIGWGRVEFDTKNKALPEQVSVEGNDSVFAWSLMAGGSYPVNEVIDVSLGYRYIATTDPEVNSSLVVPAITDPTTGIPLRRARRLDAEYDAHEGVLALRFKF